MAGTFYGADVAQLRTLASQAGSSASTLNGHRRRLAADLAASRHWQGNDATAGGRQVPLGDPAFTKHIYDDPARNFEVGPVKITTDPMAKIENHSLIASAQDARNREAREDIARAIYGSRK